MTPDSTQQRMQPQLLTRWLKLYFADVVAALLLLTHPQVQVQVPVPTAVAVEVAQQVPIPLQVPVQAPVVDTVAQPLLIPLQVPQQVPMLAVDAVAALQALIPLQIQAQAPMVVVQPQQIPPHHQVLQLTLIGLINNQTIQMMILALDIIQDAIIHSIVTAIGFVFANAN
jgi:hypothetical protein